MEIKGLGQSIQSQVEELDTDADADLIFETLSGVVNSATRNASKLVIEELSKLMSDERVKGHLGTVSPYIYTAGFLAFAGRAINNENISKVMASIGAELNPQVEQMLTNTKVRNNVVYMYALYYLMIMGREITEENMFKLLRAINEQPEGDAAQDVLELYHKKIVP